MGLRPIVIAATMACFACCAAPSTSAAVDLTLKASPAVVPSGVIVDVDIVAELGEGPDITFSSVDVVLSWNADELELIDAIDPGDHPWIMKGFLPDSGLDGLNDTFDDGNAYYQAISFVAATATPEGLRIVTLRFRALMDTSVTNIVIEPELGARPTTTKVFGVDFPNQDVTGTLGSVGVTILSEAGMSVADTLVVAGRRGTLVVSGEIAGRDAFGVQMILELVPSAESTGVVRFTPAFLPGDVDIELLNDPWAGVGTFLPLDTDSTGGVLANGAIIDNGTFVATSVVFSGPLVEFPVEADGDALGVWDVQMCQGSCNGSDPDQASVWNGDPVPLLTSQRQGVLTVVGVGDSDADGAIALGDFLKFQKCFTGDVGPISPPAYAPDLACNVHDFDDDGDVDGDDYRAYQNELTGPLP